MSDVFDYGIIEYKHRFSINRSLDDYKVFTLKYVIRMSLELKYKTVACDYLCYELQVVYKDELGHLQLLLLDLKDWTFRINHIGDMLYYI